MGLDYERNTNQTRVIGPTLIFDVPIFDWGQARVARTRILMEQNRHRVEALEINIRSEVREARARLLAARGAFLAYRDEIAPRAEKMDACGPDGEGKEAGEADARLESIAALRDYWIARAKLEAAVNGGAAAAAPSAPDKP